MHQQGTEEPYHGNFIHEIKMLYTQAVCVSMPSFDAGRVSYTGCRRKERWTDSRPHSTAYDILHLGLSHLIQTPCSPWSTAFDIHFSLHRSAPVPGLCLACPLSHCPNPLLPGSMYSLDLITTLACFTRSSPSQPALSNTLHFITLSYPTTDDRGGSSFPFWM